MEFQKGMDLSFIPELEDAGVQVKDFDGTVMDPLDLVQKYGVNSVRLRIWNAPEHVRESGGYCSYAHTLAMAKRIRAHGMSFMLDFHYSDFWADPGQQRKPKDWENLSFKELKEAVFSYTRDTLTALKEEDVLPDIVQIGNEIRSGLLFPDGELPDYTKMVQLVNAGIRGARAAAGKDEMQVMIHLDQGGRYFYLKEWFDCSFEAGLEDFDLIGLSYYPFWHGTFTDLKETMTKLIQDYKKPIMVVETAHAWRKSAHGFIDEQQEKIAGFPATPAGQKQVLDLVANIVASLPEAENLLLDVGWEDGLARWNVEKSEDAVAVQLFPEFVDPFPAPPVNAVRVEAPKNFTFSICQTVKVQEAGTYTLSVAFQGTDTTNVDVRLFLNTEEGKEETVIHPTEHAWTGYKVTCEIRKPQEVTAGIRISSPPMYGMMRNFCLQTVKREGQ